MRVHWTNFGHPGYHLRQTRMFHKWDMPTNASVSATVGESKGRGETLLKNKKWVSKNKGDIRGTLPLQEELGEVVRAKKQHHRYQSNAPCCGRQMDTHTHTQSASQSSCNLCYKRKRLSTQWASGLSGSEKQEIKGGRPWTAVIGKAICTAVSGCVILHS